MNLLDTRHTNNPTPMQMEACNHWDVKICLSEDEICARTQLCVYDSFPDNGTQSHGSKITQSVEL